MSTILWQAPGGTSLERCTFEPTAGGWRISGTVLLIAADQPHEIRYSVQTDPDWRTLTVGAHVQSPEGDRRVALRTDGDGAWSANDEPVVDLFGATDVDLSWTPATNTLPIRRLGLEVGERAEIIVAWIRFPEHEIERAAQRYERVAADTYRYTAGEHTVDLSLDAFGRVLSYPDAWLAVAQTTPR